MACNLAAANQVMRLLVVIFCCLLPPDAFAQASDGPDRQKVQDFLTLLRDPAVRTWLDTQVEAVPTVAASKVNAADDLADWENATRGRINAIVASLPSLPGEVASAASRVRSDAVNHGSKPAFVIFAGLVAAGLSVEWIYRRYRPTHERLAGRLLPVLLFALTMGVIFFAVTWPPLSRLVLLAYLSALVVHRVIAILIDISALDAGLRIRSKLIASICLFSLASAALTKPLGIAQPASEAVFYCIATLLFLLSAEFVWRGLRRPVAIKAGLTLFMSAVLAFWYLGLKGLFWLGLYGLFLPAVLSAVSRTLDLTYPHAASNMLHVFITRGARALVILLATLWLCVIWQLNTDSLGHGNPYVVAIFYGLVKSVVILLIADLIWQLAKNWIDKTLERSGEVSGLSGEEAARRGRFRTLLPILRNALAVMVVVLTGLAVLSEFGVQIGPLIAGAGIFGIALGFGSQTLVKDIISGVFYMLDDAFRVGEYIQSKSYKGTVEGFSLRSVRLRHHRGPVYTVPFGELGAVENMSRDWGVVKFRVSVSYDADVEKARKLTKKIGATLAVDPEFGSLFIEPLKMKGVEEFGDYGMVLSFGMTLRPSPLQSMIRRRANLMLREAFTQNGIAFATPNVQVGGEGRAAEAAAAAIAAAHIKQASQSEQTPT